jgi:KipI family sensor histidine kinase inhibitor
VSDSVQIRSVGDRAILVELPNLEQVLSLHALLKANPVQGQVDVVAAALTILVTADSTAAAQRIAQRVLDADLATTPVRDDALTVIDTCYEGEDLDTVAELMGLSRGAVVDFHSGRDWTAAFGGFAPGFAYLSRDGEAPSIPRRSSPRTVVPAGAVALGGHYSAVYPSPSPGGWQLIGRTSARMWDPSRKDPALIRPGNRVRFRPVRELVQTREPLAARVANRFDSGVEVLATGLHTTVQDLGRPGFADIGVTGSGALDRSALRRGNRLVGNAAGAACLESVLGGLELQAIGDQVLAVSGTELPLLISSADGAKRSVPSETPFALLAGERIALGTPSEGFRSYVALRGGIAVPTVVAARATDVLSGTGPAPLTAGTRLPVGAPRTMGAVGNPEVAAPARAGACVLRYVPGPRAGWFTPAAREAFADQVWTVTPASNRIGLRMDGRPLERQRHSELASEGTVEGAIQVPPSGLPVLFLADHPVTGGYPVIGVVISADLDKAAQLAPGTTICFQPCPEAGPVPVRP